MEKFLEFDPGTAIRQTFIKHLLNIKHQKYSRKKAPAAAYPVIYSSVGEAVEVF